MSNFGCMLVTNLFRRARIVNINSTTFSAWTNNDRGLNDWYKRVYLDIRIETELSMLGLGLR